MGIVRERCGARTIARTCFGRCRGGALRATSWNNVVRVAYEALASVLEVELFHGVDEPFALPSEDSTTPPCGRRADWPTRPVRGARRRSARGSYYIEAHRRVEARVVEIMEDLERRGGMVQAIEEGYLQGHLDEAFRVQKVDFGRAERVGVNGLDRRIRPEVEGYRLDEKVARRSSGSPR